MAIPSLLSARENRTGETRPTLPFAPGHSRSSSISSVGHSPSSLRSFSFSSASNTTRPSTSHHHSNSQPSLSKVTQQHVSPGYDLKAESITGYPPELRPKPSMKTWTSLGDFSQKTRGRRPATDMRPSTSDGTGRRGSPGLSGFIFGRKRLESTTAATDIPRIAMVVAAQDSSAYPRTIAKTVFHIGGGHAKGKPSMGTGLRGRVKEGESLNRRARSRSGSRSKSRPRKGNLILEPEADFEAFTRERSASLPAITVSADGVRVPTALPPSPKSPKWRMGQGEVFHLPLHTLNPRAPSPLARYAPFSPPLEPPPRPLRFDRSTSDSELVPAPKFLY
ncbi:hypothetical protein PM082_021432 [Marasmius tenuissimus]|nr:hypothetical protein PM082_021432 [Marasmius tenuissimus]